LRPQAIAFAAAVFLVSLALAEWGARRETANRMAGQTALVTAEAELVRTRLEGQVNNTLFLTRGLVAYAANNPRLSRQQFEGLASELLRQAAEVRNVSLAPENVLTFIYPREGNELSIGLRYMEIPEHRDAVRRVMETRQTVVAGPVQLAQGGVAFVSRTPVYTSDARGESRYWGVANVVLDAQRLFEGAGIPQQAGRTRFALRCAAGDGNTGSVFYGEAAAFAGSPVVVPVNLPGGEWELAASPAEGWANAPGRVDAYRIAAYALAIVFSTLLAFLLVERERSEDLALHDALTGLPNRLLFDLRLDHEVERAQRHHRAFALLYVDLDDFKPVNDQYGHKAGDKVLVETGRRLRTALRRVDTVARIGGDEFMVILGETEACEGATRVADKLIEALRKPIAVSGGMVTVGASIGISFYPADGATADALIRQADRAMYRAKSGGKNRCLCSEAAPA
jgi:diguanylate cyclase (GGDEF)-like protein